MLLTSAVMVSHLVGLAGRFCRWNSKESTQLSPRLAIQSKHFGRLRS